MGEIKSTLDLVMEKTRNMTLTKEERLENRRQQALGNLRGILQKYADRILELDALKQEWNALKVTYGLTDNALLLDEVLTRITLSQDNTRFLNLLSGLGAIDTKALESVLSDYKAARQAGAQEAVRRIKGDLARKRGISGSAVVPNLEADPDWRHESRKLDRSFEVRLEKAKAALIRS